MFKLLVGETIITVLFVYAPQSGLDQSTKDAFYDDLQSVMSRVKDQEFLIPRGDWNGHIGQMAEGYEGVLGGKAYRERNREGERLLEFASSFELVVTNSFFCKRKSHLVTFHSGNNQSQIDYILVRKWDFRYVRDVKVIPGEECALQHKLLTCDLKLTFKNPTPKLFAPKRRVWKLRDPVLQSDFCGRVGTLLASCDHLPMNSDSIWDVLKTTLLETTEEVCGWTRRMTLLVKWLVRKGGFGRLERRVKLAKRNNWLLRERLNMLSILRKRLQRKRNLIVSGNVMVKFSKLLSKRKEVIRMLLGKSVL